MAESAPRAVPLLVWSPGPQPAGSKHVVQLAPCPCLSGSADHAPALSYICCNVLHCYWLRVLRDRVTVASTKQLCSEGGLRSTRVLRVQAT
jgi:hypothetical protein